jgi:hypothetical protein
MTSHIDLQTPAAPSLSTLAKTTGIALVVAGVLLVTLVLPAEYGIDPVGTGRWLGLTEIASPSLRPVEAVRPAGAVLAPVQNGPLGEYPAAFKFDVFEIALGPYEYVEYKYRLEQGATMLYSWTATAPLLQDFHGEREGAASGGAPIEESFDKQDRRQASGSLTAPFSGIHGWYWENPGGETITIRLTTAGFYSSAVEIRSDRTRRQRNLRLLDTLSPLVDTATGTGTQQ